jgi:hypothetical protein
MENQEQISFGLRKITTQQFAVIESAFDQKDDNIELGTGLRFGFSLDKKVIIVFLSINFNQNKNPFLILEIGCYFEIVNNQWDNLYNSEINEIKLPMALARHLVMLSVGTIRGVLHAKTENTIFNKFFLPTINVNELVLNDVIINTKTDNIEKV